MWLLHNLPESMLAAIINSMLVVGVIGTLLSFFVLNKIIKLFPALAGYGLLLQIISVVILATGLYFKGSYSAEMSWRQKVSKLEAKVKEAEVKSAAVNTVVETKVVTQTKLIKEKADTIVKYIDRPVIREFDTKCPLPKEAIEIHNQAVDMNLVLENSVAGVDAK